MVCKKNKKVRCLFKKKVLGAVPRSSILYKFTKSSIRKEHVCFKYFFGISTKKEKKKKKKNSQCVLNKRKKRVVLKNCCEVFRDKIIKVCTKILNFIMTLKVILAQYT